MLERIKEYIDSKGISVSAFERSIGMSNASFGKSLKNKGNIGSDKIENILRIYPDINPVWLLTGKDEMLKSKSDSNIISNVGDNNINAVGGSNVVTNQNKNAENKIKELERIINEKDIKIRELQKTITDKDAMIDSFKYVIELLKTK